MVVSFDAQDKVRTYANEVIRVLNANKSSFEAQGFYDLDVDVSIPTVEFLKEKQAIRTTFTISYQGGVEK